MAVSVLIFLLALQKSAKSLGEQSFYRCVFASLASLISYKTDEDEDKMFMIIIALSFSRLNSKVAQLKTRVPNN
jgi:hypothetical protein